LEKKGTFLRGQPFEIENKTFPQGNPKADRKNRKRGEKKNTELGSNPIGGTALTNCGGETESAGMVGGRLKKVAKKPVVVVCRDAN